MEQAMRKVWQVLAGIWDGLTEGTRAIWDVIDEIVDDGWPFFFAAYLAGFFTAVLYG